MKSTTLKYQKALKNPIISTMVLLGFLCLQFHALSHLDAGFLASQSNAHHSELLVDNNSALSIISDEASVDCPSCVLSEHISVDEELEKSFSKNVNGQIFKTVNAAFTSAQSSSFHQLRAPPFFAV